VCLWTSQIAALGRIVGSEDPTLRAKLSQHLQRLITPEVVQRLITCSDASACSSLLNLLLPVYRCDTDRTALAPLTVDVNRTRPTPKDISVLVDMLLKQEAHDKANNDQASSEHPDLRLPLQELCLHMLRLSVGDLEQVPTTAYPKLRSAVAWIARGGAEELVALSLGKPHAVKSTVHQPGTSIDPNTPSRWPKGRAVLAAIGAAVTGVADASDTSGGLTSPPASLLQPVEPASALQTPHGRTAASTLVMSLLGGGIEPTTVLGDHAARLVDRLGRWGCCVNSTQALSPADTSSATWALKALARVAERSHAAAAGAVQGSLLDDLFQQAESLHAALEEVKGAESDPALALSVRASCDMRRSDIVLLIWLVVPSRHSNSPRPKL